MHRFYKKNIIPKKLKIKKKLNIALVGSGKIAEEYARVIKSFDHNISTIVSSNNINRKKLIKKYTIKDINISFEDAIKSSKNIDAWIICTSWNKLKKYFKLAIKYKLNFLIEKSIIITSKELLAINKTIQKKDKKRFLISYNRNYYDYIPSLISLLKNHSIDQITANMADPFDKILKNKNRNLRNHLITFMTSHWISLILKILKITKNKIIFKNYGKFSQKDIFKSKTFLFKVKNRNRNVPLLLNLLPNNFSNTNINFYCKKLYISLSPVEKIQIHSDLKKIKKKNQNLYMPVSHPFYVENIYKPGFRSMYFDFIQSCVLRKNKSILGTSLDDLIETYKICEILKK